jgi:hypothetical protein
VTSLSFSASVSLTNLAIEGGNELEAPSRYRGMI